MLQYAPDSKGWLCVVRGDTIVWMGVGVADDIVSEMWDLLAEGPTPTQIVEVLTTAGLARTPAFAILHGSAQSLTILARGPVSIVLRGADEETIDASGYSTWVERIIGDLKSATLRVRPGPTGSSLPLKEGVVAAVALWWGSGAPDAEAPIGAPAARFDSEETKAPAPLPEPTQAIQPMERTVPVVQPTTLHDELFGATVIRNVEDAAVRPPSESAPPLPAANEANPTPLADGDHDGETIFGEELAQLKLGNEFTRSIDPVPAEPSFILRSSAGELIALARSVVIGRSPSLSSSTPAAQLPDLVTVAGSNPDVSRNHVQIAIEGGTVVVTDLHARNGTLYTLPGKAPVRLRAGEPTPVVVGTVIDLGGGATYTVGESE